MEKLFTVILSVVISFSCSQRTSDEQQAITPVRENIEWLDVWLPHSNDTLLPRALLIGNSITRSYYKQVESHLKDKAYVGRLATSKSVGDPALIAEISLVLKTSTFDIIHFNNGLHGWGYTEEEYARAFHEFISAIRENAPDARLIWASTTPVFKKEEPNIRDSKTERVIKRNEIALNAIKNQEIAVNDLFGFVINQPDYYAGGDGIHLVAAGVVAVAEEVSIFISNEIDRMNEQKNSTTKFSHSKK